MAEPHSLESGDAPGAGPGFAAEDGPVPSPCINVCRMEQPSAGNAAGGVPLCAGCLRTLDEIAAWARLSEAGKRAVWAAIAHRRTERAAAAQEPMQGPSR